MLKLFQLEECPSCAQVRRFLAAQKLSYESIYVSRLGSERRELLELKHLEGVEVPVLVDGEKTIQGSEAIMDHLSKRADHSSFGEPRFGLTRRLSGLSFGDAVGAVKEALVSEGFGVLTEIDVKATLKKKIDVDYQNYVILGACQPKLAHQGLQVEPGLGLFLPCNVVVTEETTGETVVSAIDPRPMFNMLESPKLEPIANEVRQKLSAALRGIKS